MMISLLDDQVAFSRLSSNVLSVCVYEFGEQIMFVKHDDRLLFLGNNSYFIVWLFLSFESYYSSLDTHSGHLVLSIFGPIYSAPFSFWNTSNAVETKTNAHFSWDLVIVTSVCYSFRARSKQHEMSSHTVIVVVECSDKLILQSKDHEWLYSWMII